MRVRSGNSGGRRGGYAGVDTDGAALLLASQRDAARRRIGSLREQIRGLADEQALTTHDDEHDPEGMTIAYQRAQFQALLVGAEADLAALDQAESRLRDGTYGRCTRCGAPIGAERLTALPATAVCIDCASQRSRRRRG